MILRTVLILLLSICFNNVLFGQKLLTDDKLKKIDVWEVQNYYDEIENRLIVEKNHVKRFELYRLLLENYEAFSENEKGIFLCQKILFEESAIFTNNELAVFHFILSDFFSNYFRPNQALNNILIGDLLISESEMGVEAKYYSAISKSLLGLNMKDVRSTEDNLNVAFENAELLKDANKLARCYYIKSKLFICVINKIFVLKDQFGIPKKYLSKSLKVLNKLSMDNYLLHMSKRLNKDLNPVDCYMLAGFNHDLGNWELYRQYLNQMEDISQDINCRNYLVYSRFMKATVILNEGQEVEALKSLKPVYLSKMDLSMSIRINDLSEVFINKENKIEYVKMFYPFYKTRELKIKKLESHDRNKMVKSKFDLYYKNKSAQNLNYITSKKYKNSFVLNSFFIILMIVFVYFILKIKRQNKELNELKSTLNLKLKETNSLLNILNVTNASSDAVLLELRKKIKLIALKIPSKGLSDELYQLEKDIANKSVGNGSKSIKDFGIIIENLNDGFVNALCKKFPKLTSKEINLAVYLRMNMNSKEIAQLIDISESSVVVARSKLRSKLGILDSKTSLSTFLNSIE